MNEIEFKVSVIIPVYNAEKFLTTAVMSALSIEEVLEVILVEDGSRDGSWDICEKIEKENDRVKLFSHPGFGNRGAGASRNLGVVKANCDFISFLDADDWYLKNRFHADKVIFSSNDDIDGVYGATGFYYQDTGILDLDSRTFVSKNVSPKDLIFTLLDGRGERFTTNAITFKKAFFFKTGGFDTSLILHQDTHLWIRSSAQGNLIKNGSNNAVAVRRLHDKNRHTRKNRQTESQLYNALFRDFLSVNIDKRAFRIIFKRFIGLKVESAKLRYILAIWFVIRYPIALRKLFFGYQKY